MCRRFLSVKIDPGRLYCPIYKREYRNRAKKWIIREFLLLLGGRYDELVGARRLQAGGINPPQKPSSMR